MRILLVTNTSSHHKYWAAQLFENFNVVGICHPNSKPNRKNLKRDLKDRRLILKLLKVLSTIYHRISKNSFSQQLKAHQQAFFNGEEVKYESVPTELIYKVESVNSEKSITKARNLAPDVVCFLGGDIAKAEFLKIAKLGTLNYHSGVSPFYNGSGTTFSAVADGRPNFCGGTLMAMNERIDGGDILGHYLTPIEDQDNASTLFLKGIVGAVKLYAKALNQIETESQVPKGFKQERSVRYLSSSDWTIFQDMKLLEFERSGKMKRYARQEKIVWFGNQTEDNETHPYLNTLADILKK